MRSIAADASTITENADIGFGQRQRSVRPWQRLPISIAGIGAQSTRNLVSGAGCIRLDIKR